MFIDDTRLLVCPLTGAALDWRGTNLELLLVEGTLTSTRGDHAWPVVDGLPRLYRDQDLRGTDRLLRQIHDRLPRAHRPLLRLGLPLLQGGGTEQALHRAVLDQLRLDQLVAPTDRPARLLELGVGTGVHLEVVRRALPADLDLEYWGVDLSQSLLQVCRDRWQHDPFDEWAKLLLADAHHLPFPDDSFDRLLHVGGLGRFDDPDRVLAELLRVAAPGARVVVVGKRLDPSEDQAPAFQTAYRLLTLHEAEVQVTAPVGAIDVVEEQLSRFFYALSFSKTG